jgi:hypothetical protein
MGLSSSVTKTQPDIAKSIDARIVPAAVGADQAIAIPAAELNGDVREQGLGPELHGNAGGDDHEGT